MCGACVRIAADASAAKPLIRSPSNDAQGQVSPDGEWIAYSADDGKSFEVYVRGFSHEGRRSRISLSGGFDPRWNPDGSELFYVSADGWLMSVALRVSGNDLHPAAPQRLCKVPNVPMQPPYTSLYDVAADGKQFVVRVPRDDLRTLALTVVVNRLGSIRD